MSNRKRKILPNQELNKLAKDSSKGNSDAAIYHKLDSIAYYSMLLTITRFGIYSDYGIPFSDEIIMDGIKSPLSLNSFHKNTNDNSNEKLLFSRKSGSTPGVEIYNSKSAEENKLEGLYSSKNSTGYVPILKKDSELFENEDDFLDDEEMVYDEETMLLDYE